jgi:hypothetical protein
MRDFVKRELNWPDNYTPLLNQIHALELMWKIKLARELHSITEPNPSS